MNILVIGNVFDLVYNLPTSYTDFLEFITYNNFYHTNVEAIKLPVT